MMGHFGDRLGRKSMLVWSLTLMGLSTVAIGLLPNYAQIGVWAPALLIAFRFVQGFALGGEWGGAVLMSVEHAPQGQRGFFGSFVAMGLPAGIILSNLVFLIAAIAVTPEQFAAWAWRVPFLASAALVLVGLFVRLGVAESPVFVRVQRTHAARRMPVVDVIERSWRTVLLAAGSYLAIGTLGYIAIVYFVSYATRELGLPLTTTLAVLLLASACLAGSIVACAIWSDTIRPAPDHAMGHGRARRLVADLLPAHRHEIDSAHRTVVVRNAAAAGRVPRAAAGRVLRAVPDRRALQRGIAEPHARHDRRRRTGAVHRGRALRCHGELMAGDGIRDRHRPGVVAVRARVGGDISAGSVVGGRFAFPAGCSLAPEANQPLDAGDVTVNIQLGSCVSSLV